jgi:hypothetical protein
VQKPLLDQLSEEEVNAIRWVRREAIRVLGELRRPLLVERVQRDEKNKEVKDEKGNPRMVREGPVAALLLKIMNNDGVSPEASWRERSEAAYGLTRLQSGKDQTLQPDYVAYQLGQFVGRLGAAANNDPNREAERWTYFAALLKKGLDEALAQPQSGLGRSAFLKGMMTYLDPALEQMFDKRIGNGQGANDLLQYLSGNQPGAKTLFNPPLPSAG